MRSPSSMRLESDGCGTRVGMCCSASVPRRRACEASHHGRPARAERLVASQARRRPAPVQRRAAVRSRLHHRLPRCGQNFRAHLLELLPAQVHRLSVPPPARGVQPRGARALATSPSARLIVN